MLQFNERQYRDNLKATLGFADIPDDELYNHNLVLNSPMGDQNALSLSVGKYIDTDVEIAKESYAALEATFDEVEIPELTPSYDINPVVLTNKTTFNGNNIKYFDIDFPQKDGTITPFTVAIYVNPEDKLTYKEQINQVKNHFTFAGEREAEFLTGSEKMLSFYQFVNLVGGLVRQTDRNDVATSIAEKIAMEFEGDIELEDIKKQFGF